MKYLLTIIAVFLFLLLTIPAMFVLGAVDNEWDILKLQALELYRKGQYDRAVDVTKKALEVAEENVGPDHPDVASILNNLAAFYETQGQYAQAEPLYKRALAIRWKTLGPDHPAVATEL